MFVLFEKDTQGDYLLSLSTKDKGPAILLHRLTTRTSQAMFKKTKGDIQDAKFHPTQPHLLLVTQKVFRFFFVAFLVWVLTTCKVSSRLRLDHASSSQESARRSELVFTFGNSSERGSREKLSVHLSFF